MCVYKVHGGRSLIFLKTGRLIRNVVEQHSVLDAGGPKGVSSLTPGCVLLGRIGQRPAIEDHDRSIRAPFCCLIRLNRNHLPSEDASYSSGSESLDRSSDTLRLLFDVAIRVDKYSTYSTWSSKALL